MTRNFARAVWIPSLLLSLAACDRAPLGPEAAAGAPAAHAVDEGREPHVYELTVPAGALLHLNLPGNPGGGGFTGPLHDPVNGRQVGQFTTDILPSVGTDIFQVLGELVATGEASVGPVRGRFETVSGTIVDHHAADLRIIGPGLTPGYEATVETLGVGVIQTGSGKFHRDGGTADLTLVLEIDADGILPARAVIGTFVFILD